MGLDMINEAETEGAENGIRRRVFRLYASMVPSATVVTSSPSLEQSRKVESRND